MTPKPRKKHDTWNNIRYYINRWGYVWQFWIGPCSCHPYDVIVSTEDNHKGYSYSFRSPQHIAGFARSKGLERLK